MTAAPHPGRSYTSRSGAIVRVDYVKPGGDVCFVVFVGDDGCRGGRCARVSGEDFAEMAQAHEFQPVRCSSAGVGA